MAVEPAVPSSSATIGHTAAISLPENASPPPLRGEQVPFPQALPAPTREPMANDPAEDPILRAAESWTAPDFFRAAIADAVRRNPGLDSPYAQRAQAPPD